MSFAFVDGVFGVFGLASLWFGLRVFSTDSMVRASFSLLASFLCVAVMMLLLTADYLGAALVFMMAIEMTVMALFMVAFMMNPAGLNPMSMVHYRGVSIALGTAGSLALGAVAYFGESSISVVPPAERMVAALGHELLGDSMLVFESAGVALLATMIGAVVLSTRTSRFGGAADRASLPPPLDPDEPETVPGDRGETEGGGHSCH